jgi:hypothetical protein
MVCRRNGVQRRLNSTACRTISLTMAIGGILQRIRESPVTRFAALGLGVVLMIAAPLVSPLPGPGGIVLFAIGLGLVLRNSLWAKRRYVQFKRKRPKVGKTVDWWMRKRSRQRAKSRSQASLKN